MLGAAPDCFWETDEQGRLTYASPSVGTIFSLAIADINGKRLNDIRGVEIAPEIARMTLAAIKAQQPYRDFLCAWRPSPGVRKRWVETNAVPIVDRSGEFHGLSRRLSGHHRSDRGRGGAAPERAAFPAIVRDRLRLLLGNGCRLSDELCFAKLRGRGRRACFGSAGQALCRHSRRPGRAGNGKDGHPGAKGKKSPIATSSIRESSPMARYAGSR